jgi:hypothetical protein
MGAGLDKNGSTLMPGEGLTKYAVIFHYPEEWSDEGSATDSLDKADQVRDLVRKKLGLGD